MIQPLASVLATLLWLTLISSAATARDAVTLSAAEVRTYGIVTTAVTRERRALRHLAFGRVLDAAPLAAHHGELLALEATLAASDAEARRSERLFRADETASRRQWEAARATATADRARLQASRQRLALQWGEAIAGMMPDRRQALLEQIVQSQVSLLRAAAPGLYPEDPAQVRALLQRPGAAATPLRVLGFAPAAESAIAGRALLLLHSGAGLQTGAGLPLQMSQGDVEGHLLPAAALLADSRGVSVYRADGADASGQRFERVVVQVQVDEGDQVLVDGLADDTRVVTANAATLRWAAVAGMGGGVHDDDD